MSHDDRRPDPTHLVAETEDDTRVETDPPGQTLGDVELDIGPQQDRIGPEKGQDLVRVRVAIERVDQGPCVALGASRQVVRQNMEDQ
jgi:hypothetical protein